MGSNRFVYDAVLLNNPGSAEDELVRRCFLFKEIFFALLYPERRAQTKATRVHEGPGPVAVGKGEPLE